MNSLDPLEPMQEPRPLFDRELLIFIGLALGIAWACDFAGLALGADFNNLDSSTPVVWALLVATAWAPAIAGIITRLVFHKTLRGMGWGNFRSRYMGIGAGLMALFTILPFMLIWAADPTTFAPQQVLPDATAMLGSGWAAPTVIALVYQLLMLLMLIVPIGVFAVGEEAGWSGVLVPELMSRTGYVRASLITGVIWVGYHLPLMLAGGYFRELPLAFGLIVGGIVMVALSFVHVWLRVRSGSIWPVVLSHTLLNVFTYYVLEPVTHFSGSAHYLAGDSGVLTAIILCVAAVWLSAIMRAEAAKSDADPRPVLSSMPTQAGK